jgi:hypothetical protein
VHNPADPGIPGRLVTPGNGIVTKTFANREDLRAEKDRGQS